MMNPHRKITEMEMLTNNMKLMRYIDKKIEEALKNHSSEQTMRGMEE